jgi:hypothetical protein
MYFVTDFKKGILGRPDSVEFWEETIAQIPDELFLKKDLKILNFACGHTTEADVIVKRLKALGRTNEEIKDSIYLLDKYKVFTNDAIRKGYKHVIQADFLDWETDLEFDYALGSPPFKGKHEKGGARSIWRLFIKKAFEVVKEEGYVCQVCPGFPYTADDVGKLFTENAPLYLKNDVSEHFVNKGSDIKVWIVQKTKEEKDFIVDGNIWEWNEDTDPNVSLAMNSIFLKTIRSNELFECKQDKGYNSTQFKNDEEEYFDKPTGDSIFPIRHASEVKVCYVKTPTECHTKRKVMMTFSGYPAFEYYDETTPMSSCYQMSGYIEVKDATEATALIKLYSTKLYKFLSKGFKSAGMKSVVNYSLPKVDLSKEWSDELLYKNFKLTQEEIEYIEENI